MENIFKKLSQIQSAGYGIGLCEMTLKYDKNLGEAQTDFYKKRIDELNEKILKLQNEIIDMFNSKSCDIPNDWLRPM